MDARCWDARSWSRSSQQPRFHADPIGLNFGDNTDEYQAEAETIALRLSEDHNLDDVRRIA